MSLISGRFVLHWGALESTTRSGRNVVGVLKHVTPDPGMSPCDIPSLPTLEGWMVRATIRSLSNVAAKTNTFKRFHYFPV